MPGPLSFAAACARLAELVRADATLALDGDGGVVRFEGGPVYDADRLQALEEDLGVGLPAAYRAFLGHVGASRLFVDERGRGIDLVAPEELRAFSRSVFEGFGDDLLPDLVLVVALPRIGALGGFATRREASDGNFGLFWPEDDPASWLAEATYVRFEDWVVQVVASEGRDTVPARDRETEGDRMA